MKSWEKWDKLQCWEGERALLYSSQASPARPSVNSGVKKKFSSPEIGTNSVPTAQKTRCVSVTKTNGPSLFRSVIALYSETYRQNIALLNVTVYDSYRHHLALKGFF